MPRITRAEREMEQLLQLAGLRDALRKVTARAEAAEKALAEMTEHRDIAVDNSNGWRERKNVWKQRAETAEHERDEASQLLRDLADLLNPHEAYDATKIAGWARDTVERAREADEAQAHAADLRGALEIAKVNWGKDSLYSTGPDPEDVIDAALARTPAESLGRLKGMALREAADFIRQTTPMPLVLDSYDRGKFDGRHYAIEQIETEADRLEKEDANG